MKENDIVIDIATEIDREWASKENNDLENPTVTGSEESERWKKRSIYNIPPNVIELREKAYTPNTVSIGPYHHGEERLKAMEEHKHRALLNFLKRSKKLPHYYVDALAPVVQDLKDAYDQLDLEWKQDTAAFLKLMIVDGCFILELLRTNNAEADDLKRMGYAENDPVFSHHGKLYVFPYLKRDMLMLENQLPMLALTTLLAHENDVPKIGDALSKVTDLILDFFSQPKQPLDTNQCLHILEVYRKSLFSSDPAKEKDKGAIIRSAAELDEAGIKFEPSKSKSLKDISFNDGVLKLPHIVVDDTLESKYLNLMAFERFHVGEGNDVTSYVFFMDSIIDSAKDVSLLHSSGVIQNALGSDEAVANLFNTISKDITPDPKGSLSDVHNRVTEYCKKPWPKWKAILKHNYFTNPWAVISVIAAVFLFALTGLQTVYSVLSYHNSGN